METPEATTDETPTEVEEDQDVDVDVDDAADEGRQRLWIRALTPLLQLRNHDSDPSDRVQLAFDKLYIAACERLVRILHADLGA